MSRRERNSASLTVVFLIHTSACASAGRNTYDSLRSDYRAIEMSRAQDRQEVERALRASHLDRRLLVRAVLERNPNLEAARQSWRAALARYRQAGAWEDPMLMAALAPLSIAAAHGGVGYELEVSQRVPLSGKLDAQAAIAAAEAQTADRSFAKLQLELAQLASDLYDDYAAAARAIVIQVQHVALLSALQDSVRAAYASGHAGTSDALQAETELAKLEYQTSVFETQRDVSVARLNALLHRDPAAALPAPAAELHDTEGTDLDLAISKRPDIASGEARARVANARVQASEREFYPDLTLSASYNSMWAMPEHRFMTKVSLVVPLQRERLHGAVEEARAMHIAAESELVSLNDAARSEVAVALRNLQQAQKAVQLYEQRIVPLAHERIDAARASFITSQTSFGAVLEAARALRSAELELAMAHAERNKRSAALDAARGRIPGLIRHKVAP